MDPVVNLGAGLDAVDWADIVLKIVFLTVPGIALAQGLKRFREPGGPSLGGGKTDWMKAHLHQLGTKLASFITVVAMLAAGLGLVPLAQALYRLISGINPMAPALIGVAVLVLLFAKGLALSRDLKDGKIDRPQVLLAAAPLVALLIWVFPMVVTQITDQATETAQMVFGRDGENSDNKQKSTKSEKKDENKDENKDTPRDGGANGDADGEGG